MWAQFTDSEKTVISAIFFAQPSEETAPYQAEITTSDSLYKTYYESLPVVIQGLMPVSIE